MCGAYAAMQQAPYGQHLADLQRPTHSPNRSDADVVGWLVGYTWPLLTLAWWETLSRQGLLMTFAAAKNCQDSATEWSTGTCGSRTYPAPILTNAWMEEKLRN